MSTTGLEVSPYLPPDPAVPGQFAGNVAMRGLRLNHEGPVVFLHNVGTSYADLSKVKGVGNYSGRILGATLPGDVVHLSDSLRDDYGAAMEHYRDSGLECAKTVIWDMDHQPHRFPEYPRSVFLFSDNDNAHYPDRRRLAAVGKFNDKNRFLDFAQREGYPVPATSTHKPGELPERPANTEGPWYVKGAVSASGSQVFKCATWDEVMHLATTFGRTAPYQVQEDARATTFLNVQYNGSKDGTEFIATTEQVLDGFAHAGNRHPSRHDPRHITDRLAEQTVAAGVRGIFAYDVAVSEDPDTPHKFIECNPRPNGSSYFTAVAERAGVPEWSGVSIPTAHKTLEASLGALGSAGLLFDPAKQTGGIVVNWGTAADGKLGILFAGPESVQNEQQATARQVLAAA